MRIQITLFLLLGLCSCSETPMAYVNDIAIKESENFRYEVIEVNGHPPTRRNSKFVTYVPFAEMPVGKNMVKLKRTKINKLNAAFPHLVEVGVNAQANDIYKLLVVSGNLSLISVPQIP
jgi:hypothetical protein